MGLSFLLSCTALLVASVRGEFRGGFSNIMFQGGFETGNLNEYSEIVENKFDGKEVRREADGMQPRCGDQFMKVRLNGGMFGYGLNRNEIGFHPSKQTDDRNMAGTVRYYGWSMAHSSSQPITTNSNYELAYWESEQVFAQTIGFYAQGNNLILRTRGNGDREVGRMNFQPGKWHDFVMGIRWSSGGDGWVELWMDGQQVVQRTNHQTMMNGNQVFNHFGIFRIPTIGDEVVMYYDCAVYAQGFDPEGCYNDGECERPDPTAAPTELPTPTPTQTPTRGPTAWPTAMPTPMPTEMPTESPTMPMDSTTPITPGFTAGGGGAPLVCAAPMMQCGGRNDLGELMPDACCSGGATCVPLSPDYKQCQGGTATTALTDVQNTVDNTMIFLVAAAVVGICLLLCCSIAVWWVWTLNDSDDVVIYQRHDSEEGSSRSRRRKRDRSSDRSRSRRDRSRSRSRTRKKGKSTKGERATRNDTESSWVVDV